MLWIREWVLVQNQGACTVPSEKRAPGEQSHSSHKKDEGEESESSLDGILSDEEGSIGEYEEDDGEWSSSDSDEISPEVSDSD